VISALRQFGLIEDIGDNCRVSESAYLIFSLSDGAPKRQAALKQCALKPSIYREILKHFSDGLPSDEAMKDFLIAEKKFNPASVDTFLRIMKSSLSFAKVTTDDEPASRNSDPVKIAIGDFVQWESQGVLQFEVPKAVLGFSDDGTFAFVEGSATGIHIDQVQKVDPPPAALVSPPPPTPFASKPVVGVAREVSNVENGEVLLQWPAELRPDEIGEIEDWLSLVIKKMKRRYGVVDGKREQ
jgi:hypothetical protein